MHRITIETHSCDGIRRAFGVVRIFACYLRILAEDCRFSVRKLNRAITLSLPTMRGWPQTILICQGLREQKDSVVARLHVTDQSSLRSGGE
jgi:hypothetical protein